MNTNGHTPGPWSITRKPHSGGEQIEIESAPGNILKNRLIAVTWPHKDEDEANARLIAAAPELLEALQEAPERMLGSSPAIVKLRAQVDAAIAKATS